MHVTVRAEQRNRADHGAYGGENVGDEIALGHVDFRIQRKRAASLAIRARGGKPGGPAWMVIPCGSGPGREECEFRSRLKRSEEHTSELQSRENLVCRLLL